MPAQDNRTERPEATAGLDGKIVEPRLLHFFFRARPAQDVDKHPKLLEEPR